MLNAQRIYSNKVFQCHDIAASQRYLSSAIVDHEMRWSAGDIDSALFTLDTGRVQMMVLRYGPEVEIRPQLFEDFALVQIPLRGSTEISCDGRTIELHTGQSALVAPRRQLRLLWSQGCEQLILRIPHALFRAALASCSPWQGQVGDVRGRLPSMTLIDEPAMPGWLSAVQALIDVPGASDGVHGHPAWSEYRELGVAIQLLMHQDQAGPALDEVAPRLSARANPMRDVERYVRTRLCAPLALEDLARAAGVSARTVHIHCKARHGVGPMAWLRQLRLDAAREMLRQDANANVTEVALACGFGHLGRFAGYYRARFGELPRQTAAVAGQDRLND